MSRIVFNKISFKNFQSFGNDLTTIDLDKDKISLICGTNGSGKTCVIQTISYALFGKSLTGISKSDLINNKNKKNLWVQLTFTIGADRYVLTRGDKPAVLTISKNGEDVPVDGDSRIFQKKLEEDLFRFDFKAFKQLVCLGSEFTRFFKMTAAERRTFIEGILDLQIISEMAGFAKEELKTTKKQLEEFTYLEQQKKSNLEIYEEEQRKENQNISERKNKMLDEEQTLITEIGQLEKKVVELTTEFNHFNALEKEENSRCNQTYDKLSKLTAQEKTGKDKVKELETELEFYKEHSTCPTCKQTIGEEFIKNKTAELHKKISSYNNRLEEISGIIIETRDTLKVYEENRAKINNEVYNKSAEISAKTATINEKKKRIESIHIDLQILESVKPGGSRETVIAGIKDELEVLSTKIKNYNTRIEIYNIVLQILSDSGVKQAIISNYIDYINQQLAVYLERFNFNFSIEFDSEFNDEILMDFRDKVQYESLSEGQKARLEFCILMVWRDIARTRNSVSTNLLSIDELFDSALDDAGMQDMIDVLKGEDGNIFVISHKNVKSMFDHIYEITKEKYGFSELKEL